MINYFKKTYESLFKTRKKLSNYFSTITGKKYLDEYDIESIEELLIESDVGWQTTSLIIDKLKNVKIDHSGWQDIFFNIVNDLLTNKSKNIDGKVIVVVGINGTGKTTSCAKLAKYFSDRECRVLLVGSDTYRAAANQQIEIWADKLDLDVVYNTETKDPAAVSYDGVNSGLKKNYDKIIIDTAGRLHTSRNLMEELSKIRRVISKLTDKISVIITLDANTGQNGLSQIKEFQKFIPIDGVILTKLDGTAKGGVIINIMNTLNIPVSYIGIGEGMDDLAPFDINDYLMSLIGVSNNEK